MSVDADVVEIGGRRLTAVLIGAPIVLIFLPGGIFGIVLFLVAGWEMGFRFAGLVLAVVGLGGAWLFLRMIRIKPLVMRVGPAQIQLRPHDMPVSEIDRDRIGCIVRCDSVLSIFDVDDQLLGQWGLRWLFPLSHHQFIQAMRRFDYPCRIFSTQLAGNGGRGTLIETHRTGPLARDPELGPVGILDKFGLGEDAILKGPGLTAGPAAEFFGMARGSTSGAGDAESLAGDEP